MASEQDYQAYQEACTILRDLDRLRSQWRTYKRRHDTTRPPFTPTAEQLPHYDDEDLRRLGWTEVQLRAF